MTTAVGMDADTFAAIVMLDLDLDETTSDRSLQKELGGSEIGGCREYARRRLADIPADSVPDKTAAKLGRYLHEAILRRRKVANPRLLVDHPEGSLRLVATIPSAQVPDGQVAIPLHPDEIDPDEPSVNDFKTKDGLAAVRRIGLGEQYRFQRHLQYLAAHQAGLVPAEGIVRNTVIDRSGREPGLYVEQEPFSMDVIRQASEWLDDVFYAHLNGQEASRDKDWRFCERFCQFFLSCRGGQQAPAEITDPEMVAAAHHYYLAQSQGVDAGRVKDQTRELLKGVNGVTADGALSVRWVSVLPGEKRAGYDRLDVRPCL